MTHTKSKIIKEAYNKYSKSNNYNLYDVYGHFSYNKQRAFEYCQNLIKQYNGWSYSGAIISYNTHCFSFGFIGYIYNREAFFYITRDYDRYIFIDEI